MSVTGIKWQEGPQILIASGSFSRALQQPMPRIPAKIVTQQTFAVIQEPETPSFLPVNTYPNQQSTPSTLSEQGVASSMQSEIASLFTGSISNGVGYDAKTGHAIGGNPQYVGTKFGSKTDLSSDAEKDGSIYSFSYGSMTAIPVHKTGTNSDGGMQEHGRNPSSKSRYFDWRAFYNARLFTRIMQKASNADHKSGLMKFRSISLNQKSVEDLSKQALENFLNALDQKQRKTNLVSFVHHERMAVVVHHEAPIPRRERVGQSFWDIYGSELIQPVNLR